MEQKKELTTADMCQMHGGLVIAKRHIEYIAKNVLAACDLYDNDGDNALFLAHCAYAIENIEVVGEALDFIENTVKTMRAQVAPDFSEGEDEQ